MEVAIGVGLLMLWVAASLAYLIGLGRLLARKERALKADIERAIGYLRQWEAVLRAVTRREWRRTGDALARSFEAFVGEAALPVKVQAGRELRQVLGEQRKLVAQDLGAFPLGTDERAEDLERALARMEERVAEYNVAASGAEFARERFPLSLFAALAGLNRWSVIA